MMSRLPLILSLAALLALAGCDWQYKTVSTAKKDNRIHVVRYDRIEALYLTTGDLSALQRMRTDYPAVSGRLLEDVLRIGCVADSGIFGRMYRLFEDSAMQRMVVDAERLFASTDDLEKSFNRAFKRLKKILPDVPRPTVYLQIGALDESVVVSGRDISVNIDKYLGADYPLYADFYKADERRLMTRSRIVADCLYYYIMSQMADDTPEERIVSIVKRCV